MYWHLDITVTKPKGYPYSTYEGSGVIGLGFGSVIEGLIYRVPGEGEYYVPELPDDGILSILTWPNHDPARPLPRVTVYAIR